MSIIYGNVKPTFMEIYPDWKYITKTSPKKTVLKAGTPLGVNGRIANNDGAIGLVAENTGESDNPISIIVGGAVDLAAVQSSYTTLTTACKNALKGILFINSSGKVDVSGDVPVVGSGDKDKYLHSNASTGAMEWVEAPGGGGAPCVVFSMDSSGNVSCSHTASQLAAICTQYGAGDSMGGTVCAVPAVVTGDYNAAGSLWLYVGDMQSSLSSASLRAIAYVDVETVTVIDITYDYGVWGGFYINVPIGGGMEEG